MHPRGVAGEVAEGRDRVAPQALARDIDRQHRAQRVRPAALGHAEGGPGAARQDPIQEHPRGRVAVGAGWQNGESALSVGYAKPIGTRASFSIGGAFTDDDSSAGIGFGLDL